MRTIFIKLLRTSPIRAYSASESRNGHALTSLRPLLRRGIWQWEFPKDATVKEKAIVADLLAYRVRGVGHFYLRVA